MRGQHVGFSAVHDKQEPNRAATASHEELPRLPSRDGRDQQKTEGVEKDKMEGIPHVTRHRSSSYSTPFVILPAPAEMDIRTCFGQKGVSATQERSLHDSLKALGPIPSKMRLTATSSLFSTQASNFTLPVEQNLYH
ncbi:hypothetical protein AVEN_38495-1 [Araneus ventricosus]|uniref:Uncharacterized protein n=1 Tax=Araneus ventricosus TaxID=182803 RepID=A0A4Y2JCN5_ARAVE|nr:hypothetical protein AVEN_38495-1 [Araneus ventricosus]